jgi:Co/Zn/Cd efflux system component
MGNFAAGGAVVAVTCLLSIIVSIFALVLFGKRARLHRRAHLIPLFHLAVVDLLAMVTWSVTSVVIAVADWTPDDPTCKALAFLRFVFFAR